MKDFFKYFFASLLAIVVSGILLMLVFFGIMGALASSVTSSQVAVIKSNSILEIDLSKPISEIPQANILSAITGGAPAAEVGLFEIMSAIELAKADENIKGIYIKAGNNNNGWATSQQLRKALEGFKKSGKFIYAYADGIAQKAYYVASVADSVFLNPIGNVELKGLSTNIMFYKGLLDKLEVEPEIFYCGKFKSATEPIRAYKMTPENRAQIAAYQKDLWSEMLVAVSEHTKMDTATIDSLVQKGAIQTSTDAIQYRLVDGLKYKDEMEQLLKAKSGIAADKDLNFASLSDYKSRLSQKPSNNHIALLIAEGSIVDGRAGANSDAVIASEDFIKEIRRVRDDENVKAVVLRVNSPGGSALASENILRELQLLKAKKKLVTSMGDYAASGGYYIACQSDSVFAMPNTITGSIGVFGIMMNTQKLFNNKLGITFDVEKNAPMADMGQMNRPFTEQERNIIQHGVDTIYSTFKSRVAAGRNLSMEYVDSVGQGRVWTGTAALGLNLVDGLGGLDRALKAAAKLAGISEYRVVTFPKPTSDIERLLKMVNGKELNSSLFAKQMIQNELGYSFDAFQQFKLLMNNQNQIWTMLPFLPDTK
ncbi:signal peptide peptidase SppA [Taibaiella sp. KBW10]|uniref:signal peptide peptidase SppA n=1 Tax=Taibaiella sp. KBW10 TaxID=2153357 RepID=UPI000F5A0826|nr:signal peptide peptidase SppA [Taibaiella sp. KBW10]RQO31214.1 signal peptide peptidase SppA [Taibaiella sp. KBW10]